MDRVLDAQGLAQGFVTLFILSCLLLAIGAGVLEALLTLRDGWRNQSPSPELMKAAEELVAATVKFPGTTGWERGKRGGMCPGCETPGDATNTVAAIINNTPMDPSDAEYLRKLAERLAECEAERLEQALLNGKGSEREARLLARLAEALRLLRRYRTETPLGHQPHMIAHEADAVLRTADSPEPRESDVQEGNR